MKPENRSVQQRQQLHEGIAASDMFPFMRQHRVQLRFRPALTLLGKDHNRPEPPNSHWRRALRADERSIDERRLSHQPTNTEDACGQANGHQDKAYRVTHQRDPLPIPRPIPSKPWLLSFAAVHVFRDVRQASRLPHWPPSTDAPPECPQSETLWMVSPYSGLPPPFRQWTEEEHPRGETLARRTRSCRRR